MNNRFRLYNHYFRRMEELGVSPLTVLRQSGLPASLLKMEKIHLTTQELFSFWQAIGDLSNDPLMGLKLGNEERVALYDPITITALNSKSFRDALTRLAKYKQLTCPEEIIIIDRGDDSEIQFNWLLADEPEPDMLIDVCFSCMVGIARQGTNNNIHPMRVELIRPRKHQEQYEKFFQCPVQFNATRNTLVFRKSDLDMDFLTHNSDLLAIVTPQLDSDLNANLAEQTISSQIKAILKRFLVGHRPTIQEVAVELRTTSRTLQRRLIDEGTNFQQLLVETRRELAHHYLSQSSLELAETAYLLGYEDANSFYRAFHNWEGTTPGQWRAKQQTVQVI